MTTVTPAQLNDHAELSSLYGSLVARIALPLPTKFVYAERGEDGPFVKFSDNRIVFEPVLGSLEVVRLGRIAGRVASVSLHNNDSRDVLHVHLAHGPLLVVNQGARFGLDKR